MCRAQREPEALEVARSAAGPYHARTLGRPSRDAVLDAAGELLVTCGLVGVTIDAVAERAHVSKSTIRRWWPSEEALALDALRREWVALARQIRRGAIGFGL
jgi:AcrR family transcriptional regulator